MPTRGALLLNLHRLLFLHFFSRHVWITKTLEVKQPTDRIRKINISHTTQKCIWGQQSLKERVKWCIANESNTGSEYERPWLQYTRLCIILLSQCFPVLVRMAYFYSKGCTHLLTLVLFFFPSLRVACYPSVSLTWGSLRAALVWFPHLPSGSIRIVVQWTSPSRWWPAVCPRQTSMFSMKKMTIDVFVCCWWQLHTARKDRNRQLFQSSEWNKCKSTLLVKFSQTNTVFQLKYRLLITPYKTDLVIIMIKIHMLLKEEKIPPQRTFFLASNHM